MKKLVRGALVVLALTIAIVGAGLNSNGAPALVYVYSNSMEPLIKVNDAFIIRPAGQWHVGDIVMYRPVVLKAPTVTHRIIAVTDAGFITKGDNSSYADQDSGEPEVSADRIVGKVVTICGKPVIFPGLGRLSAVIRSVSGQYARYLSGLLLAAGIIAAAAEGRKPVRARKSRLRLRLRHIYRAMAVTAVCIVVFSVYMSSDVTQIKYLVSEYPGTSGDQVEVNKPGELIMTVKNNGLVPVLNISAAIEPLGVRQAPDYIMPFSKAKVVIDVLPQKKTGYYQGYIQSYNYPVLMPRTWIAYLHKIDPLLALAGVGLAFGAWLALFLLIAGHIRGFEGWIPLRAIKDKMVRRRMQRARARFLGRRRVRP